MTEIVRGWEQRAQLEMVEDLAVERQQPAPGRVRHRLMPGGTGIDYRQPRMAEADCAVDLDAGFVRTTVGQSLGHLAHRGLRRTLAGRNHTARDSAHRGPLYALDAPAR